MPILCKLKKTDVYAMWINPKNGAEVGTNLANNTTLDKLESFGDKLNKTITEFV